MPYVVKTESFEGPLHLLLDLIEKRKLLINDISLSSVADDFIAHIKELPELPLTETAEFVSLAATLLLIKSRSLLPSLSLTDEEESDVLDLERRLALLSLMRKAGKGLEKSWGQAGLCAGEPPKREPVFAPDRETNVPAIAEAMRRVLFAFPKAVKLTKVAVKTVISLEDMIVRLTERISRQMRLSFKEFSGKEKTDVIVSFLALLELVKQGILHASQEQDFGDIVLETETVNTPTYG